MIHQVTTRPTAPPRLPTARQISGLVFLALLCAPMVAESQTSVSCTAEIKNIYLWPRWGGVGVNVGIVDSGGNVVASRYWILCDTEIADSERQDLDNSVGAGNWVRESECQTVLNTLQVAKAADKLVGFNFRGAPTDVTGTTEATSCEEIMQWGSGLKEYLHFLNLPR